MADPTPYSEAEDDTARRPSGPGMPRWVKISLVIAILLILAFVVTRLLGVQHGPGLHGPPQGSGDHTASVGQLVDQP
jgi:hypothetical protein